MHIYTHIHIYIYIYIYIHTYIHIHTHKWIMFPLGDVLVECFCAGLGGLKKRRVIVII